MSHTTRKEGVYELWNVFAAARDFDEITETYSRLERVCDGRVRAALSTHYRAKRLVASLDTNVREARRFSWSVQVPLACVQPSKPASMVLQ